MKDRIRVDSETSNYFNRMVEEDNRMWCVEEVVETVKSIGLKYRILDELYAGKFERGEIFKIDGDDNIFTLGHSSGQKTTFAFNIKDSNLVLSLVSLGEDEPKCKDEWVIETYRDFWILLFKLMENSKYSD